MGTQGKQALLLLGSLLAFAFIPGLDRVTLEPQVSWECDFLANMDNIGQSSLELFYTIQFWFVSLLRTGRLPKVP